MQDYARTHVKLLYKQFLKRIHPDFFQEGVQKRMNENALAKVQKLCDYVCEIESSEKKGTMIVVPQSLSYVIWRDGVAVCKEHTIPCSGADATVHQEESKSLWFLGAYSLLRIFLETENSISKDLLQWLEAEMAMSFGAKKTKDSIRAIAASIRHNLSPVHPWLSIDPSILKMTRFSNDLSLDQKRTAAFKLALHQNVILELLRTCVPPRSIIVISVHAAPSSNVILVLPFDFSIQGRVQFDHLS